MAAAANDLPRVQELVAAGANPYDADQDGRTAFNHAASNGLTVLEYLTEIAFEDTQREASKRRWKEYGVNTPSGKYGSTLITYACKACAAGTVERLFAAGATPVTNGSGWNLLHATAVMPGRMEVVKLLRQHLGSEGLGALTTHAYVTDYDGQEVRYPAGATPHALCAARIAQDKNCPRELRDYLALLEKL